MKPPIITIKIYDRKYTNPKPPQRPRIIANTTYKVTEYAREGKNPLYYVKAGKKKEIMFYSEFEAYKYLRSALKKTNKEI